MLKMLIKIDIGDEDTHDNLFDMVIMKFMMLMISIMMMMSMKMTIRL